MKPWQQDNHVTFVGDIGYNETTGILKSCSKGWYLFTLSVKCRREFGNATIAIKRVGGGTKKAALLLNSVGDW